MLTVVDLVCMPERRRYTLGINLIAAFSSYVTFKVNVYLVLRLLSLCGIIMLATATCE